MPENGDWTQVHNEAPAAEHLDAPTTEHQVAPAQEGHETSWVMKFIFYEICKWFQKTEISKDFPFGWCNQTASESELYFCWFDPWFKLVLRGMKRTLILLLHRRDSSTTKRWPYFLLWLLEWLLSQTYWSFEKFISFWFQSHNRVYHKTRSF